MKQKYKDKDCKIIEIDVCPHCKGLGELHFEHNPSDPFSITEMECQECNGTGEYEEYLNT